MFTLHYKLEDQATWKVYGTYKTEAEALADATECLLDGYIIQLEQE